MHILGDFMNIANSGSRCQHQVCCNGVTYCLHPAMIRVYAREAAHPAGSRVSDGRVSFHQYAP